MSKEQVMNKILQRLGFLSILMGIGIALGFVVPVSIALAISIFMVIFLILTLFIKFNPKTWNKIAYIMSVFLGILLNFTLTHYVESIGADLVIMVFSATLLIYVSMAVYGFKTKRNFSGLGTYLFYGLIALLIVSILGIFILHTSAMTILISSAGAVIFTLYTLYDFNQIAQSDVEEEEITYIAFNLLLDFYNLFLYLLRLVESLR